MKLAFLFVGGQKEDWVLEASDLYLKKINYQLPAEIIRLRPSKAARADSGYKKADETKELLKHLKPEDLVIVCDEKGTRVDSIAFSKKLVGFIERGRSRIVIVIGGAYGIGPEVQKRGDWIWSLSDLTFNHHLAQVLTLEQVYRALSIWKNLPYHNE